MAEVGQEKKRELQNQIESIKKGLTDKISTVYKWTGTTVPEENQLQSLKYTGFIKLPTDQWVQVLNLKKEPLLIFLTGMSAVMKQVEDLLLYFYRESDSNDSHYAEKKHKFWSGSKKVSTAARDFLSFKSDEVKKIFEEALTYIVHLPKQEDFGYGKNIKYFKDMLVKKMKAKNKVLSTVKSLGKSSGMNDFKEDILGICIMIYNILYSPGGVVSMTVLIGEKVAKGHNDLLKTIQVIKSFQEMPEENVKKNKKKLYDYGQQIQNIIGKLEDKAIFSKELIEELEVVETSLENWEVISEGGGLLSNLAIAGETDNSTIDDDSSVPPLSKASLRKPEKKEDEPIEEETEEELEKKGSKNKETAEEDQLGKPKREKIQIETEAFTSSGLQSSLSPPPPQSSLSPPPPQPPPPPPPPPPPLQLSPSKIDNETPSTMNVGLFGQAIPKLKKVDKSNNTNSLKFFWRDEDADQKTAIEALGREYVESGGDFDAYKIMVNIFFTKGGNGFDDKYKEAIIDRCAKIIEESTDREAGLEMVTNTLELSYGFPRLSLENSNEESERSFIDRIADIMNAKEKNPNFETSWGIAKRDIQQNHEKLKRDMILEIIRKSEIPENEKLQLLVVDDPEDDNSDESDSSTW